VGHHKGFQRLAGTASGYRAPKSSEERKHQSTARILITKDGARITEELMSHSTAAMKYSYRIIDSPLPVTNYLSTLKVNKTKTGSTVVWTATFKAKAGNSDDDAKKTMAGVYRADWDNLKNVVEVEALISGCGCEWPRLG